MDETDARALIEMLQTVVATACNQHGLSMRGPVDVSIERRWDRATATLTIQAEVEP